MIAREIAVVGCGPSGMAAALFLAHAGERVRLFERVAAPRPVGSGLLLQPTGLAVLAALGLESRIRADGQRIDRLHGIAAGTGRAILDIAYDSLRPGLHGLAIHRASLFAALFGAIRESGIELLPATEIVALEAATAGRVVLLDGRGDRHGPFDLVVDASGIGSRLRAGAGLSPARPFAYGALWTTLPLAGHSFVSTTLAQRYVGARRMIGVMPVGRVPGADGPQTAFFYSLRLDAVPAWRKAGLAAWKAEISRLWPEAAALLGSVEDLQQVAVAAYAHATARQPVAARLVLIGDSAHSTSPQLGQGANMGLLDAMALAVALEGHPDADAAIAAYVAARRRHVRLYQAASWWMTPLFQSDSRIIAAARDRLMPLAARLPFARREMVRMLAGLKPGLIGEWDPEAAPRPRISVRAPGAVR